MAIGHDIIGVDSLNDYYNPKLKEYRLESLKGNSKFEFQQVDLSSKSDTEKLFDSSQADSVVHLAAQAGVRYSIEAPHSYTQNNIEAYLNVLEGCRHNKIARLVYASSSSVYGGNKVMPFSESQQVDHPISLYAATKKANELMAHTYSHLYKFETVGLRFFTVYGPKGRPDMALWLFTDAILNNRPIKVFNNGKMRRDFTYVEDIVQGIIGAIEKPMSKPATIFNLGNNETESLEDMSTYLEVSLGKNAIKDYLPMQPGDVAETYADISLAREHLGYNPKTSIKVGIPNFVDWYQNEWLPYSQGRAGSRPRA
jgi:UDP-glucuronate 4-epimerase